MKVLMIGVDLAWGEKMHDGVCFVELDGVGEGCWVLDIHKEIGIDEVDWGNESGITKLYL